MIYEGCHSYRLYATELCAFGLPDPRSNPQAYDNVAFVNDDGGMGSGILSLDQQVPGFKASDHMPVDSGKIPEQQTLKPN